MNFFEKIVSGRLFSRRGNFTTEKQDPMPGLLEETTPAEGNIASDRNENISGQDENIESSTEKKLHPPREEVLASHLQAILPFTKEKLKEIDKEQRKLFHPQRGPGTIIKLFFMEKEYIVEDFNLNFKQEIDETRNIPGSLPYGGVLSVTISETPDNNINEWMIQPNLLRNGEIKFFPNEGKVSESALLTIAFQDAYCVEYRKSMETSYLGLLTTLLISPRSVKIGNEEFENSWKKTEEHTFYIRSV